MKEFKIVYLSAALAWWAASTDFFRRWGIATVTTGGLDERLALGPHKETEGNKHKDWELLTEHSVKGSHCFLYILDIEKI